MVAKLLRCMSGVIGSQYVNGAFFSDGSFRSKHGLGESMAWNIEGLPTFFRTQTDVRSTMDAVGGRTTGGRSSVKVANQGHAVAWKERPENNVTLAELVGNNHSTLFLTKAEFIKVLAYYSIDAVKAA